MGGMKRLYALMMLDGADTHQKEYKYKKNPEYDVRCSQIQVSHETCIMLASISKLIFVGKFARHLPGMGGVKLLDEYESRKLWNMPGKGCFADPLDKSDFMTRVECVIEQY
jgi:hypothetical protein